MKWIFLFTLSLYSFLPGMGQNPVPALGFLEIEPDSRGSAIGLTGVASSPDNYVFYNPAKISMITGQEYGVSAGYVPYLRQLAKGMGMASLQGFRRMSEQTAIGLDLRYFALGKIRFKDDTGYDIYQYNPTEWTIGITYSRIITDFSSIGLSARYVNSRPAAGIEFQGQEIKTANALAMDIGYYYCNIAQSELPGYTGGIFRGGISLANLGTKVKYHAASLSAFQPMNMRAGLSYTFPSPGEEHHFTCNAEAYKLLVPSPAVRNADGQVISGKDPETTNVPAALFASLGEMKSWGGGLGVEYNYQDRFFLRGGVHYENPDYSSRQLVTVGAGFLLNTFHLDISYYAPLATKSGVNYQGQTFKISLGLVIPTE